MGEYRPYQYFNYKDSNYPSSFFYIYIYRQHTIHLSHALTQAHLITAHRKQREKKTEQLNNREREREMKSEKSHPRLRASWEGKTYKHGFSSSEIDSLTSICEAVFPPLDPPPHLDEYDHHQINGSLQSFFQSSASQKPIPDEVNNLTISST